VTGNAQRLRVVPDDHIVNLYEHDHDLVEAVCDYLNTALRAGDGAVVVATPEHRASLEAAIEASGTDLRGATNAGRYVALDARGTLATFMVDDEPDAVLFESVVGQLIAQTRPSDGAVRVFGEMVALLWDDGNVTGALSLESLWNDLGTHEDFSLYCAYRVRSVQSADHLSAAKSVCDLHSGVATPPHYGLDPAPWAGRAGDLERAEFFVPVPLAARAVRRFVADALDAWQLPDMVDDASIVVSELATNAMLHASSPFWVTISRAGSVVKIAVHDASCAAPAGRPAPEEATSGRGMEIVAALSLRSGTDVMPDGKIVWAELSTRPH
jgi:hypothetical protein